MNGNIGMMVLILVAGAVIGLIRSLVAGSESKEADEAAAVERNSNNSKLESVTLELDVKADSTVSTDCAAAALDKSQRKLTIVSGSVEGGKLTIDLTDIERLKLDDRTPDYKYCQKQARVYTAVERYSDISRKDAKYGYERLETMKGEPIYSVVFVTRDGSRINVPFMKGDGTLFWNKEEDHNACKAFVKEIEMELNNIRREEAKKNEAV